MSLHEVLLTALLLEGVCCGARQFLLLPEALDQRHELVLHSALEDDESTSPPWITRRHRRRRPRDDPAQCCALCNGFTGAAFPNAINQGSIIGVSSQEYFDLARASEIRICQRNPP